LLKATGEPTKKKLKKPTKNRKPKIRF